MQIKASENQMVTNQITISKGEKPTIKHKDDVEMNTLTWERDGLLPQWQAGRQGSNWPKDTRVSDNLF